METIYGRLGGAAKREPAVDAAPTPETDSYPTGSVEALIHASRNHNGMSAGMPKIHVDSGWIEHILIRSRKLERERDDHKDNALRLHKEKMHLWESINFPGGWKSRVEAAEKHLREIEAENLKLWEDAERYRFLRGVDAHGIQVYDCVENPHESIIGTDLDRTIDAARKAKDGTD